MKCDVCYGTPGRYPVIDRFGTQRFEISCPECDGSGEVDDPKDSDFGNEIENFPHVMGRAASRARS